MTNRDIAYRIVDAVNTRDRDAFFAPFVDVRQVRMCDDGRIQDFFTWAEREVFAAQNRFTVDMESQHYNVIHLEGTFQSVQWGSFRTFWNLTFDDEGRVVRFAVGAM